MTQEEEEEEEVEVAQEEEAAPEEEPQPAPGKLDGIMDRVKDLLAWLRQPKPGTAIAAMMFGVKMAVDASVILRYASLSKEDHPFADIYFILVLGSLILPRGVLAFYAFQGHAEPLPMDTVLYNITKTPSMRYGIGLPAGKALPGEEPAEKIFDRWKVTPSDDLLQEAFAGMNGMIVRITKQGLDPMEVGRQTTFGEEDKLRSTSRRLHHAFSLLIPYELLFLRHDLQTWEKPVQRDKWIARKTACALYEACPQSFLRSYLVFVAWRGGNESVLFAVGRVIFTLFMLANSVASYRSTRNLIHNVLLVGESMQALLLTFLEVFAKFGLWVSVATVIEELSPTWQQGALIWTTLLVPTTLMRMLFLNGTLYARYCALYGVNGLLASAVVLFAWLQLLPETEVQEWRQFIFWIIYAITAVPSALACVIMLMGRLQNEYLMPGVQMHFPYAWASLANLVNFTGTGSSETARLPRMINTRLYTQLTFSDITDVAHKCFTTGVFYILLAQPKDDQDVDTPFNPLDSLKSYRFFEVCIITFSMQMLVTCFVLVLSKQTAATSIFWEAFFAADAEFEYDKGHCPGMALHYYRIMLLLLMMLVVGWVIIVSQITLPTIVQFMVVLLFVLFGIAPSSPLLARFSNNERKAQEDLEADGKAEAKDGDGDRALEEVLQNTDFQFEIEI